LSKKGEEESDIMKEPLGEKRARRKGGNVPKDIRHHFPDEG
jgi:hypothetical protein